MAKPGQAGGSKHAACFPFAGARYRSLSLAEGDRKRSVVVLYSPLISVACEASRADPAAISLQSARIDATMDSRSQSKQGNALRLIKPELTLQRDGASADPRLVDLVRLLARRAARNAFEQQMRERRRPHP